MTGLLSKATLRRHSEMLYVKNTATPIIEPEVTSYGFEANVKASVRNYKKIILIQERRVSYLRALIRMTHNYQEELDEIRRDIHDLKRQIAGLKANRNLTFLDSNLQWDYDD